MVILPELKSLYFTFHVLISCLSKIQKLYIQKSLPFLYSCTTQQIENVSDEEWAQLSHHHHRHNPFLLPFLTSWNRKEQADRNKQNKRGVHEIEGKKGSYPNFSCIHLVSDICFFIATWWHYSPLVLAGNHLFITWQLSLLCRSATRWLLTLWHVTPYSPTSQWRRQKGETETKRGKGGEVERVKKVEKMRERETAVQWGELKDWGLVLKGHICYHHASRLHYHRKILIGFFSSPMHFAVCVHECLSWGTCKGCQKLVPTSIIQQNQVTHTDWGVYVCGRFTVQPNDAVICCHHF